MPVHAGFAYAIQIRKKVLNDSILLAYHAGSIRPKFVAPLPYGPPGVFLNFYFDQPVISFDAAQPTGFLLTITGFGILRVDFTGPPLESHSVKFQIVAIVIPRFAVGQGNLTLSPKEEDVKLSTWSFSIIDGGTFSSNANTYLTGPVFKDRLETSLAQGLATGLLKIPPIQIGALGSSFNIVNTTSVSRVLDESILIGLNLNTGSQQVVGEIQELTSFAGSHDIAFALNPAVIPIMFEDALLQLNSEVADAGATLDSFTITLGDGKIKIMGSAHNYLGTTNFSLDIVLSMFAARSGKYFQYLDRHVQVNARIWPAVNFHVENVHVDVDPEPWVILVEAAGVLIPPVTLCFQDLIRGVTQQVTLAAQNAPIGLAISRIQYLKPKREGDPRIKLRINDFSIRPDAIFSGLGVTPLLPSPVLMGLTSIPSNFLSRPIRYHLITPIGVLEDDPALNIRWQVQDLNLGQLLVDEDGAALGRLDRDLRIADYGSANVSLGISCELYRRIGNETTSLFSDGIRLKITPPLVPGVLTRWQYQVNNPQVKFSDKDQEWKYLGESRVARWSAVHRLDKPCKMATLQSRYVGNVELLDDFPYPLTEIADRRQGLCDYCFFGGPGGKRPFL